MAQRALLSALLVLGLANDVACVQLRSGSKANAAAKLTSNLTLMSAAKAASKLTLRSSAKATSNLTLRLKTTSNLTAQGKVAWMPPDTSISMDCFGNLGAQEVQNAFQNAAAQEDNAVDDVNELIEEKKTADIALEAAEVAEKQKEALLQENRNIVTQSFEQRYNAIADLELKVAQIDIASAHNEVKSIRDMHDKEVEELEAMDISAKARADKRAVELGIIAAKKLQDKAIASEENEEADSQLAKIELTMQLAEKNKADMLAKLAQEKEEAEELRKQEAQERAEHAREKKLLG